MSEKDQIDEATKAFYTGGTLTMIYALQNEIAPINKIFNGLEKIPERDYSLLYNYIEENKDKVFEVIDNVNRCVALLKEGLESMGIDDTRIEKVLRYKEPKNGS